MEIRLSLYRQDPKIFPGAQVCQKAVEFLLDLGAANHNQDALYTTSEQVPNIFELA